MIAPEDFDITFPARADVARILDTMAERVRAGQLDATRIMLFSDGTRQFDFVVRGFVASGLAISQEGA